CRTSSPSWARPAAPKPPPSPTPKASGCRPAGHADPVSILARSGTLARRAELAGPAHQPRKVTGGPPRGWGGGPPVWAAHPWGGAVGGGPPGGGGGPRRGWPAGRGGRLP